ncbi:hypothetical protein B9Z55_013700 [Caenorhabditis nigoni]|uniref:Uncharacterized protein n=1 Tax=Caenorhabditis nigoni TaxID=1611254 RepID=A0A2G5U2W2_9PELO|nr:hypothetical protein B9Z55_013700 [Caenorhabditis nigoni]
MSFTGIEIHELNVDGLGGTLLDCLRPQYSSIKMKFGTSFVLFAAISMMFAVAYAEDEAPEVVVTTEAAPAEALVTGAASGGADVTKEAAAGGDVTGKAGGAAVDVSASTVAPLVTSEVPVVPSVETTTKGSQSFVSQIFAVGCIALVALFH